MSPSAETLLSEPPPAAAWADDYAPPEGYFDELRSAPEETRPYWDKVIHGLKAIGQKHLQMRVDQQRRIIQDNGITYNAYTDPKQGARPWSMDIIPLLLGEAEWHQLELALSQRLHLLNLILQDCYGRQNLLRGSYPPELVLGNPAFLRSCRGIIPPRRRFLHLYTADLARAPDGSWWVLSDRLDAASGLGYALENRFISSRVLPDVLRPLGVRRLQPHLQRYCAAIERLAPRQKENPLIVLLTPGPFNETYFEQSFLARQLGYPLVEGADLTVRENRVYLKTTDGMRPVDVILRRLDSDYCDPLELRDDSLLGVPGLLNAVRCGNVAVTNIPGAALLETPALLAFLPGICRNLLGEELKLPSVATWWCGQKTERDYVLANLHTLALKPTFRTYSFRKSIFGPSLSSKERADLRARIQADPQAWCAQEIVSQATAPVFADGRLQPRHFLLRCFLVLGEDGRGYLMPGGLGRAARSSPQTGDFESGESKDVWVVSARAQAAAQTVEPPARQSIRRSSENLPSRVADNLFWLGRYVERVEGQVRGLLVILRALQESTSDEETEALAPFIAGLLPNDLFAQLRADTERKPPRRFVEAVIDRLVWDTDYPMGLSNNLGHVNRTTYTVRERISGNTTQLLRNIPERQAYFAGGERLSLEEGLDTELLSLLDALAAFSGMVAENTTRGQDWFFLDLGRRLERSLILIDVLGDCLQQQQPLEALLLSRLLDFADSTMTYRRRYLTAIWPRAVCDLLVLDPSNPRSLSFQVERIRELLRQLPHHSALATLHPLDRQAVALTSTVSLLDLEAVLATDESGARPALTGFFGDLSQRLTVFSDQLSAHYFAVTAL
ncbi:MAG: circularly permuted type 2 ATP-grasp protein [Opitutales bacterium]